MRCRSTQRDVESSDTAFGRRIGIVSMRAHGQRDQNPTQRSSSRSSTPVRSARLHQAHKSSAAGSLHGRLVHRSISPVDSLGDDGSWHDARTLASFHFWCRSHRPDDRSIGGLCAISVGGSLFIWRSCRRQSSMGAGAERALVRDVDVFSSCRSGLDRNHC